MDDQQPKCTRLVVTAIYADGSSMMLDVREPEAVMIYHESKIREDEHAVALASPEAWQHTAIVRADLGEHGTITTVSPPDIYPRSQPIQKFPS